jgi:fructose-1,6-bisphosphatase/inositol monophosphatase family enzyme
MKRLPDIGGINEHVVGLVMKECVRRSILIINSLKFVFEVKAKADRTGGMTDVYTDADTAAQALCVKLLSESFPGVGIIAEEGFSVPCTIPGCDAYFTLDPLDGTKAWVRRQSHGIGTMISLVVDGEVVAAYVGDVNTSEIYGYRPGSRKVHRITTFQHGLELTVPERTLSTQYALLRDGAWKYSQAIQDLVSPQGIFKGQVEVSGGSIGLAAARLWKCEVGALILHAGAQTPWDLSPVVGISRKLGFVFLEVGDDGMREYEPLISKEETMISSELILVHGSRAFELLHPMQ